MKPPLLLGARTEADATCSGTPMAHAATRTAANLRARRCWIVGLMNSLLSTVGEVHDELERQGRGQRVSVAAGSSAEVAPVHELHRACDARQQPGGVGEGVGAHV